jgi:hypothetical protein
MSKEVKKEEYDSGRISSYLKFTEESKWLLWKPRIMAKFYSEGLWEVVSKTNTEEEIQKKSRLSSSEKDLEKQAEKERMKDKVNMKAYMIFMETLSDEIMKLVSHIQFGDANGIWITLCEHFERNTTTNIKL